MTDHRRVPGAASQFADGRGGPGNFAGTTYQVQTQVRLTLRWLAHLRRHPASTVTISCEPRHLVADGQLGFDIGLIGAPAVGAPSGGDELFEVKLRPTHDEVLDLVGRACTLVGEPPARPTTIHLVAAESTAAYKALERLTRLAGEAGGDATKFAALVSRTGNADLQPLYDALGDDPCAAAAHLATPQLRDRIGTQELVRVLAEVIAEPGQATALVEAVTVLFHEGSTTRRTFPGPELVRDLESRGLLASAPIVDVSDVSEDLIIALTVLQRCEVPLPVEVLAEGLDMDSGALRELLAQHEQMGVVERDGDAFWLAPLGHTFPEEWAERALVRTLQTLNRLADRQQSSMAPQTLNAEALARTCMQFDLRTVAFTFKAFDKASKAWGDLWTVYELAQLSAGALATLLDDELTGGEAREYAAWRAQTYICGQSWVLQRVDDLPQAESYINRARALNERHGTDENRAFAAKCEGRIQRMVAETLDFDDPERAERLDESTRLLRDARTRFDLLHERAGTFAADRGECVSLLARTVVTAADFETGRALIEEAHRMLDSLPGSKAYADLVILDAEVAALHATSSTVGHASSTPAHDTGIAPSAADPHTGTLTGPDGPPELRQHIDALAGLIDTHTPTSERFDRASNEITARARVVLGSLHELVGEPDRARQAYLDAVEQYERLRCHIGRRDEAAWLARVLDQPPIPEALLQALDEAKAEDGARLRAADGYFELWTPTATGRRMAGPPQGLDLDTIRGLVNRAIDRHTASRPRWGEGRTSA